MKRFVFKTTFWPLIPLLLLSCSTHRDGRLAELPELQRGDMVFLDLDCGPLCDAIEDVTLEQFRVSGPRLSHVGVMISAHEVIEAWPQGGVHIVSLNDFLKRVSGGHDQPNGFYLGILKADYRSLAEEAASRMEGFLGLPYNDSFDWNKDRFYCSELVSFGYADLTRGMKRERGGLFSPKPMYFGKKSSTAFRVWKDYFTDIGLEVPKNQPGVSPLGIYLEGQKSLFVKP